MSKIKILSPQEVCKIAAGEVVERPANIVKELVENALDAGANVIEIYLEKSGKKAIRIVDNGCGMSAQDAKLCFEHHATSKINSVDDLDNLTSFGFRGEALSSIAAVSKIELITCEKNATCGTQLVLHAGQIQTQVDIASPVGSDLLITDLFYNMPARQKFLKKDDTEWRAIVQLFYAFVFDYTGIHFKLYHDNSLVYNCPPVSKLNDRIMQLWDVSTANNMLQLPINDNDELKVNGMVSNHQVFRYNRASIFCFVNKRLVKNYGLIKALLKGYANVLPAARYPLAVLFIELPNNQVDINVHPRKEEVSFLHPKRVENFLTAAVKKSLEDRISDQIVNPKLFNQDYQYQPSDIKFKDSLNSQYESKKFHAAQFANFDFDLLKKQPDFFEQRVESNLQTSVTSQAQTSFVERDYEIIGQFKKTYIIISNNDGLLLVDQHAAHERVLYERFKNRFNDVVAVNLMFPQIITLSQQDLATIMPHLDILKQHGIGADVFGQDQLVIQSTPTYLKQLNLSDLIYQVIAWVQEYQQLDLEQFTKQINERLHAQMACKAAVKAGDVLASAQMYELLDDLQQSQNHLTCPHGRPTTWSFSLNDIEKKFKRKL